MIIPTKCFTLQVQFLCSICHNPSLILSSFFLIPYIQLVVHILGYGKHTSKTISKTCDSPSLGVFWPSELLSKGCGLDNTSSPIPEGILNGWIFCISLVCNHRWCGCMSVLAILCLKDSSYQHTLSHILSYLLCSVT